MSDQQSIALCECGCGNPAPIAKVTDRRRGYVKGQPLRFIYLHQHGKVVCRRPAPLHTRIVVDEATGCWIWQGHRTRNGYGVARRDGKAIMAHRASFEEHRGAIPAGLDLDHLCRNRACINPDHLEPATRTENARRGSATVLTADQVREIRRSGERADKIAQRFGLSPKYIANLRRGVNWPGVS